MPMYRPVGHRVLVKLDKKERKTEKISDEVVMSKGGIYLPVKNELTDAEDRTDAATEVGVLVELGKHAFKGLDGCDDEPWAELGDRVVFPAYNGRKFEFKGDYYRIFEDQDIFAVELTETEAELKERGFASPPKKREIQCLRKN